MQMLVVGISGVALLAGLIVLGVAAARFSLGIMAGRHLAAISVVLGANWAWGLVGDYGSAGTEDIVGVMALIAVCCAILGLAFACARRRFRRSWTHEGKS